MAEKKELTAEAKLNRVFESLLREAQTAELSSLEEEFYLKLTTLIQNLEITILTSDQEVIRNILSEVKTIMQFAFLMLLNIRLQKLYRALRPNLLSTLLPEEEKVLGSLLNINAYIEVIKNNILKGSILSLHVIRNSKIDLFNNLIVLFITNDDEQTMLRKDDLVSAPPERAKTLILNNHARTVIVVD